ncbi:MAG: HGGxSTG domain-containing protein [Desulfobacteria bacterium]
MLMKGARRLWGLLIRGVGEIRKTMNEPHANRNKRPVLLKNGNPQGNPMNAPRCGAKTRSGTPCKAPAMANGRCRMHGGKSTGPRTPEGLGRSRKANLKHGLYSAESIAERRYISQLLRDSREILGQVDNSVSSGF